MAIFKVLDMVPVPLSVSPMLSAEHLPEYGVELNPRGRESTAMIRCRGTHRIGSGLLID
ncbi:hypothetical protein [Paracoccus sp. SM22M-07]|uniref:hypothetical protein n=1 Tax=Paracoccus sp. SM22M-07 TaxID=1520813 RepID=UPI001480C3E3|nr:hypothetical protein [Paracoccus sp. SM22M-07]